MDDKVGLAIVGCGYWGSKHVRVSYEAPQLDVTMAVDARAECRGYISSQYPGVSVNAEFSAALESDAAGIILATPISTHFELAKKALEAGKHVLVEKPLATTSAECRELIAIAKQRNLILMVGHTFEYHPAVMLTRDIVQSGRIGEPYYANSRRLNLGLYQSDTNVLWDLAPHDLSIMFSVMDSEIETIDAWGCQHVLPGVEDVVYSKMGLGNGATAHIHVSWLDPVKVRQFTVVGSEGMLVFDDIEPVEKVKIYDKRFSPVATGDSFADFQTAYHNGEMRAPEVPPGEPLKLEVLDFANAIRTGEQPRTHGGSGLRVVNALERISECLTPSETKHDLPHQPKIIIGQDEPEVETGQLELR